MMVFAVASAAIGEIPELGDLLASETMILNEVFS